MNIRQFQYALTLAHERSFSRAAEKLGISQPSLSQYIKKIENEVGAELFSRGGVEILLTEAGEAYIDTGRKILDLENRMRCKIDDISDYRAGKLVIGISPYRAASVMPRAVAEFASVYPGIRVVLLERRTDELKEGAEYGEFDLCVSTMPIDLTLFEYAPVMNEETLLAVPKSMEIDASLAAEAKTASGRPFPVVSFRRMEGQRFVSLCSDQLLGHTLDNTCTNLGVNVIHAVECINNETLHAMVAAGLGAAIVPYCLVMGGASDSVSYYSIAEDMPRRDIVVFYRRGTYLSAPMKCMVDILRNCGYK